MIDTPLYDSLEAPFSPLCPSAIKVRIDASVRGCVSLEMKHFDSSREPSLSCRWASGLRASLRGLGEGR